MGRRTDWANSGARQYPLLLPRARPTVRARDEPTAPDIMLQGLIAPSAGAQRLQAHFRHGPFAEQLLSSSKPPTGAV
ncbi:hypothetical protein [Hymenobacter volaticus]|uniref:Uncharacterized protein n=1 Tax=Hymenobacter volaticus TaxID=2932254 RepID=A0ABY4GE72_9BACT|nr:hypothetical protein [Hymenobacter volaticus]UOQ69061.1 hypothetical protein MUN86_26525 [Hymenobacter volaticus]